MKRTKNLKIISQNGRFIYTTLSKCHKTSSNLLQKANTACTSYLVGTTISHMHRDCYSRYERISGSAFCFY